MIDNGLTVNSNIETEVAQEPTSVEVATKSTSSAAAENDSSSKKNALEPSDMTILLKSLDVEIATNEQNLNDENDKRYMFKVCLFILRKCFYKLYLPKFVFCLAG